VTRRAVVAAAVFLVVACNGTGLDRPTPATTHHQPAPSAAPGDPQEHTRINRMTSCAQLRRHHTRTSARHQWAATHSQLDMADEQFAYLQTTDRQLRRRGCPSPGSEE
jgi:hypothetical protein